MASSNSHQSSIIALVKHINDAANVLENYYTKSTSTYGLTAPSLDCAKEHPLDQELMSREARVAVQTIEAACAQLVDTVGNPNHILANRFMEFYYPTCINIALIHKVPDLLQDHPEGMHITDLGAKTGIHHLKLGRVLRLLAARHIFKEVSEDVFSNNRLSLCLLSGNPITEAGLHFADEAVKSAVFLPDLLTDKDWGRSFKHNETAFNKYTGFTGTVWDHYETDQPVGTHRGARFGRSLKGWAAIFESLAVVNGYPWQELGDNALVCDLGCGVGTMSMALAKKHSNLRFVLHDLPVRMEQAKNDFWPKLCPEALEENRVQFVPLNFFTSTPASGCDVYYLINIIHDWSDETSIKILSNIREVMAPHSRVLIQEHILQPSYYEVPQFKGSDTQQAPYPLLPNYGAGRIRHNFLDLHFMTMLNGEVRTLPHFCQIGETVGLRFVKVWDIGETGILEFTL